MKNSIALKFIAIALCAAALLAIIASGLGILLLADNDLYSRTVPELYQSKMSDMAYSFAQQTAQNYASIHLGQCPEEMVGNFHYFNYGHYGYILKDENGHILESLDLQGPVDASEMVQFVLNVSGSYMKVADIHPAEYYVEEPSEVFSSFDIVDDSDSMVYGIQIEYGNQTSGVSSETPIGYLRHDREGYLHFDATEPHLYHISNEPVTGIEFQNVYCESLYYIHSEEPVGELTMDEEGYLHFSAAFPTIEPILSTTSMATIPAEVPATVSPENLHYFSYWDGNTHQQTEVEYTWEVMPTFTVDVTLLPDAMGDDAFYTLAKILWAYKDFFPWLLALGLFLFAVTAVYLCCAAGRRPGSEELRISGLNRLPLDLYLAGGITLGAALLLIAIEGGEAIFRGNAVLGLCFGGLMAYLIALVIVGFCFACAAQFKARQGYWWKHMVLGWGMCKVGNGLRFLYRGCRAIFKLLPVIWQWLLTAFCMASVLLITVLLTFGHSYVRINGFFGLVLLTEVIICIVIICYGGWCFGTLMKGAKAMAQGDLNHHIPTKFMFGSFRNFGNQLNNLADAAYIAAEKQLKSERMKTELITNVSHDIKTPLTSIINFVDLLKKPHTDAEGTEYLEVLDRQSQRLKKLIDDLMEMSKASTGNMTVELGQVDAAEAVNQALGEFSDKLDAAHLSPVFRHPEEPVIMTADGRLVWRVLSNLLSNAVKYALPDTRLYIDLMVLQGNAVIAIKNISREQLNMGAEELMERFVRGDTSRNTEGSGLGLNIAKSLVEIQKGQMHLMVDGDLFKVTLIFPLA